MSDSSNVSVAQQPQEQMTLKPHKEGFSDISNDGVRKSTMEVAEKMATVDEESMSGSFIKSISRDERTLKTSETQKDKVKYPIPTNTFGQLNLL